ncbi:unnamed protein product [Cunninghamella blakesleeana]
MLQEYPFQVQPKSSSTRHHNNIVDAEEAGNILITLSNQTSFHLKPMDSFKKSDNLNHSSKRIPYRERARSDPIMLLAAAAAAIDNSNVDDFSKGRRHYERREIIIQKRPPPPSSSNSMSYHRNSISSFDSYDSPQHYYSRNHQQQHQPSPSTKTSDQNYALQYFSMKHNPKIKRNAMHAYITYMIYTDLAANDSSMKNKKRVTGLNDDLLNKKKKSAIMDIDEEVEEEKVEEKKMASFQTMPPSPPQHPYQQQPSSIPISTNPSSTLLPPPSSLSNNNNNHSSPSYRSLTAYLWDSNNHSHPPNPLNGHPSRNKMVLPPLAPTRSYQ